jgi:hypothetical protein
MSTLETMFGYSVYHLILHWNHYLYSQPLTGNSFAIDHFGTFPFPVLLILSLPLSFFLQLMLSLPCFFYKKAPTPIGPPHFKLLHSSLDLDPAIWFLLLIQ